MISFLICLGIFSYVKDTTGLIYATHYGMGLYEFIALDINTKADTVWNHATYLMTRQTEAGSVNLYALEDFYVEIYYDQE